MLSPQAESPRLCIISDMLIALVSPPCDGDRGGLSDPRDREPGAFGSAISRARGDSAEPNRDHSVVGGELLRDPWSTARFVVSMYSDGRLRCEGLPRSTDRSDPDGEGGAVEVSWPCCSLARSSWASSVSMKMAGTVRDATSRMVASRLASIRRRKRWDQYRVSKKPITVFHRTVSSTR